MTAPVLLHRLIHQMNVPFTVSLAVTDRPAGEALLGPAAAQAAAELARIDRAYSPFRSHSLVRRYQAGDQSILLNDPEFQQIYAAVLAAAETTQGDFDPFFNGPFDPTGCVKGWAVARVTRAFLTPLLNDPAVVAVGVNGGGDMQLATRPGSAFQWHVGIEDPADPQRLIAAYTVATGAVATSGTSKRGEHVLRRGPADLAQVTILAPDLPAADVWATAGLAGGQARLLDHIAQAQLTGLFVTAAHRVQPFAKGVLANAQTA